MTPTSHASALAPFPEWMDLQPSTPLRQGDVLVALGETEDHWHEILVILTADCDLAQEKHGGALTCVPILRHGDYLRLFRVEKLRRVLCDRIVARLVQIQSKSSVPGGIVLKVSEPRMREWVTEVSDIEAIISALRLTGKASTTFRELSLCVQRLSHPTPDSLLAAAQELADAKFLLGEASDRERALKTVANDLSSSVKDLPGDALFLNQVSQEHVSGYVAYLRRVLEVKESLVVRTMSRLPSDVQYIRVSRLRSPYIYALSQQFANVFSAIGLPSEYETARDLLREGLTSMEELP